MSLIHKLRLHDSQQNTVVRSICRYNICYSIMFCRNKYIQSKNISPSTSTLSSFNNMALNNKPTLELVKQCPKCSQILSSLESRPPILEVIKATQDLTSSTGSDVNSDDIIGNKPKSLEREPFDKGNLRLVSLEDRISGASSEARVGGSGKGHIDHLHPTYIDLGQSFKTVLLEGISSKVGILQTEVWAFM